MTAPAAQLCPQCLAARVIATAGGPTCTHQPNAGVKWFPAGWGPSNQNDGMTEGQRVAWLKEKSE